LNIFAELTIQLENMSENITNNKNVRDDEIDLLDLFKRIGKSLARWAHSVGRAILITIVFLIKKWLPLNLSIILAIVASYFFKMTSDSLYSSDLIMRTNSVSTSDMINYINRLHKYCEDKNISGLVEATSLPQEQIYSILDISAFWIIDKGNDGIPDYVDYNNNIDVYDTINVRVQDTLDIRVRTKSPQELINVRNGIISFINSDSLFQRLNRIRLRQTHELLTRLNYDILQLDSLQKVKYFEETKNFQPKNGGQMIFLQEQKTQLVYPEIHILYYQKQQLEANRDLYKDIVTVLSEFSVPAKRDNGLIYYAKYLIPFFFLSTLLALLLLTNRKKLKELYTKY
jgi:hypothetical protein